MISIPVIDENHVDQYIIVYFKETEEEVANKQLSAILSSIQPTEEQQNC
jgi:hypothetical protein